MFRKDMVRATTSSTVCPTAAPAAPENLRDSPSSVAEIAALFVAFVKISAYFTASVAPTPNWLRDAPNISAASSTVTPRPRAKSIVGEIALTISEGLKPMRPSAVIPSATCDALQDVLAPNSRATSFIFWSSCSVAFVTPFNVRMRCSKSAKALTPRAAGAANVAPRPAKAAPRSSTLPENSSSLLSASSKPLYSLELSAVISTYAPPAFTSFLAIKCPLLFVDKFA